MSRSVEELFSALGTRSAHEVSLRSLHGSLPPEAVAAMTRETPAATYVASSATAEIGVDFSECMRLLARGARVTGSIVHNILDKRRS
ncbi:MAG TPA: hypothetical protein VF407_04315 [Polyangiaceae bacterium]